MVTQLLFGEILEVTGEQDAWRKVRIQSDAYEGWVDAKQLQMLSTEEYYLLADPDRLVCPELVQIVENITLNQFFPILIGSSLPTLVNGQMQVGQQQFRYNGHAINTREKPSRSLITEQAMMYLNAPYQWGGRSPFGIDCSGLVQIVFKQAGVKLRRDAREQAMQGETISFVTESLPGDIAFFDNDEQNIVHTGILLGDNRIIHASGKVRIDAIDHHGIFNYEIKRYTHKLRLIKRVLPLF
jgi:hypothetical protein